MKPWILSDKEGSVWAALIGRRKSDFFENLWGQDHYFALKILKLKKEERIKELKRTLSFEKK